MSTEISPLASVSPKAKIGNNVKIFPFAWVEDDVEIGDDCIIFPYVSVMNGTRMGHGNRIYQNTVLAAVPQDFHFTGEWTELVIGNDNIIRENVVINRATHKGDKTIIGDNNFLMEGVHISHDTHVANQCVFGYGVKIAGLCEIGNGVIFSSSVIENAKTRVGEGAMIQAGTTFSKDVPPYIVAGGTPVGYHGINSVMMTTYGIDEKIQKHIANAYRLIFHGMTGVDDAVRQVKEQVPDGDEIRNIVDFMNTTKKGIITKM
jgi:acyl-ACP--UDP-N-acetylglucosamine O-acyltransferase